jgi:hypothetical protein
MTQLKKTVRIETIEHVEYSEYQVPKPKPVAKPDFSRLISMSQNYLEALEAGTNADDYDGYIYEEALAAIFGPSVFDYINERID